MKKLVIVSALILSSQTVVAEGGKNFNVKIGAHGGGFGFGPALDYKINKNWTVGLGAESASITSGSVSTKTSGMGVSARYYFSEALAQGTYIGGVFMQGSAEGNNSFQSIKLDASSLSVTYGKTWMWDNFNLDAGIGLRNSTVSNIETTGGYDATEVKKALNGTDLSMSISAGFAF